MVCPKRRAKLALVPIEPGSSSMVVACRLFHQNSSWRFKINSWSWTHDTRAMKELIWKWTNKWGCGFGKVRFQLIMGKIVREQNWYVNHFGEVWKLKGILGRRIDKKQNKKVKGTWGAHSLGFGIFFSFQDPEVNNGCVLLRQGLVCIIINKCQKI